MRRLGLVVASWFVAALVSVSVFAQSPVPPHPGPQAAPTAGRASADVLPFKATETTLANGLRIIVVPTGFPNIVSLQIPVQTGSRNEVERGRSGFAHFFEHLMFRGTPTTPPAKFQEVMVKAGARENAGTGDDVTTYYATFAKDDLEPMLRVYADMFQNLAYSEADFKTESRAILGEYNKNSANPLEKLFEVQRDAAYSTHTYKHTTMGFIADIEDMPNQYAYSKIFFERWYRPQFATVVVAGDVDARTVMPLVERYWGAWKTGNPATVDIPKEPAPSGRVYAHVPWATPTPPWVTVGFHAAAFSDVQKDYAALDMIATLYFGETSDLYKKLVVTEQKADEFGASNPSNVDPGLFSIVARLRKAEDAVGVRDDILKTIALARSVPVSSRRLDDAKAHARYALTHGLDSTERIAGLLAYYVSFARSYQTVNNLYRVYESLTPADLQQAAQKYFTDAGMVVTTLASEALPAGIGTMPTLESLAADASGRSTPAAIVNPRSLPIFTGRPTDAPLVIQKSLTPQLDIKLLFSAGSAVDPPGKEGLAALAGAMIADAGSKAMSIEQIGSVLYPIAGSFTPQVDKEMTTFTGAVHRDNWRKFLSTVLPQLLEPGFRPDDFTRIKSRQLSALVDDLRSNNEEELGKERLQTNIFAGTPYGHPVLGTVAGLAAISLDDVRAFVAREYAQRRLTIGVNGNVPDECLDLLKAQLGRLPMGAAPDAGARPAPVGRRPVGLNVEIIEKDTRSTAISLGLPSAVTRAHPDFAALSVARVWLGEHRASSGRLYQRIREVRGMNYGDYAYIEAFPRGMFRFFPEANLARRAQLFEIWIRPVTPENGHMALRLAIHELEQMLTRGLSTSEFTQARDYLMKNVFVMTARQDDQLGYALDSRWYGTPDFTDSMRSALAALTPEQVNAAIRKHWSANDLSVVIVTKDATGLRQKLLADALSPITYDSQKPAELLAEDKVVGARKLNIDPTCLKITAIADVFSK